MGQNENPVKGKIALLKKSSGPIRTYSALNVESLEQVSWYGLARDNGKKGYPGASDRRLVRSLNIRATLSDGPLPRGFLSITLSA